VRYVFYIFAALLVYMSFKSFRGGIEYLRYFRRELSKPCSDFAPYATVIVPCRGLDEGLAENLAAILEQDYPDHEVVFVVDSEDDPSLDVVKLVCRDSSTTAQKIKTVIAPRAVNSSQKVENLREAVLHASGESQIFAFVDSDTRPSPDWLRGLVAPLEDRSVGAATGYRWFISDKMTFGSEMRSVWNASIASALGPNRKSNFCWGGSMALKRDTFDLIGMRERWRGTLSDDFAVTAAVRQAGLDIYFVPQALTASTGDCTLAETVEFTNRQMKITRVYSPHLWMLSFFGSLVFNAVMASALAILVFSPRNDATVLFAGLAFIAVALFSIGKSWTRLRAVELVLAERWPGVRRQWISQNTLWLLSPSIFLINCISAALSRKIVWRGIRYELKSPTETVIITD
jgi:cellulose synthase/poly-beta-1,6-N-acetylglucosamine synthase-like glycosyltransferase